MQNFEQIMNIYEDSSLSIEDIKASTAGNYYKISDYSIKKISCELLYITTTLEELELNKNKNLILELLISTNSYTFNDTKFVVLAERDLQYICEHLSCEGVTIKIFNHSLAKDLVSSYTKFDNKDQVIKPKSKVKKFNNR